MSDLESGKIVRHEVWTKINQGTVYDRSLFVGGRFRAISIDFADVFGGRDWISCESARARERLVHDIQCLNCERGRNERPPLVDKTFSSSGTHVCFTILRSKNYFPTPTDIFHTISRNKINLVFDRPTRMTFIKG